MSAGTTLIEAFRCGKNTNCFEIPADLQKTLYWYNGIFDVSAKGSMPPDYDLETLLNSTSPRKNWAIGIRQDHPDMKGAGIAQGTPTGDINVPTLYVCGSKEPLSCVARIGC